MSSTGTPSDLRAIASSAAVEPEAQEPVPGAEHGLLNLRKGVFETLNTRLQHLSTGPIVRSAASLFGSTIITSLLGFAFWLLAARLLSPATVGVASATLSAAQFVAYVCIFGLGTVTIAEFAEGLEGARRLLASTIVVTAVLGVAGGTGVGVLLDIASPSLRPGLSGPLHLGLFVFLCGTATVALLLDDACIGLLRGEIQLRRNTIFAATKLFVLPVLALAWQARGGMELMAAWLVGTVVSLIAVRSRFHKATPGGTWKPDFRRLVDKRKLIYAHHWLNISIIAPNQIFPLLVASLIGPAANAAFYSAMLLVSFVNAVPSSLSTALFALRPGDDQALRIEVLKTIKICLIVSAGSALFFLMCSRWALDIFRPSYAFAAPALALLGLTTFPASIKAHYVAIARVKRRMRQAAFASTGGAALQVVAVALGATTGNLVWVALALDWALALQGALFLPSVWRSVRRIPEHTTRGVPAS